MLDRDKKLDPEKTLDLEAVNEADRETKAYQTKACETKAYETEPYEMEPVEPAPFLHSTIAAADESDARWYRRAQWSVVALGVGEAVFLGLYRGLMHIELGHSAALFVGLPAVLAILLALAPRAKSVTGGILRGMALALLLAAPLLGEGFICILIASPLFFAVGLIVGLIVDGQARRRRAATLSCVAIAILPFCLEGVVPQLTHERGQTVEAQQIVAATPQQVEAALAQSPRLAQSIPRMWRLGFPLPLTAHGEGLSLGSLRTIRFSAAEHMPEGDLVMRVTSAGPGYVQFEAVSDHTKIGQWMRWRSSAVVWQPVDATHTRVTWQIAFDRQLDPWWYFGLWERAAVGQAARYLIAANATPPAEPGEGRSR